MGSPREKIVISVGGSLVVPNGGIDTEFLIKFNKFIRTRLAENKKRQFFLIAGGGSTTRHYQNAGRKVIGDKLTHDDLDWLGIHATRLNAHLIRTIFRDVAHPYILKHYEIIRKVEEPVVVGSGWKPGWSTDFCAIMVCQDYGAKTVINLSNINQICDKDPNKSSDAKPINKISWRELRKLVGDKWTPGMHVPFDPIAAKKAQSLGVKAVIVNGRDFDNLENYFRGRKFTGTVIK
ncbi:MAG: aspartate kinase [Candidatus Levybacteria bacterium RIFCSPLOWO2_01_FULL_39_24]|nr:MAG: aspartate kinase [Candidatus Levybacteria bacterium RIFCSPHIGHO2_01_FULL_40_16]OGH45826.1 MAG: aspartate kinase [Candidatus Levybacteria bacterium RIFCSPLOWO2_01_FULL_39_24]